MDNKTPGYQLLPEPEYRRAMRAEQPYVEALVQSPNASILAAHATTLEKAALASITGSILPGKDGLRLGQLVFGDLQRSSSHPTEDVRFSVWEVNPQYSIVIYPAGVQREWERPKGEVFFAAPTQTLITSPHVQPHSDYSRYGVPSLYEDFLLDGTNGLLAKADSLQLPYNIDLRQRAQAIDQQTMHGRVGAADYLAMLDLYRRTGPKLAHTDQPILEIGVASPIPVGTTARLYMPEDFQHAFAESIEQTYAQLQNFPATLSEILNVPYLVPGDRERLEGLQRLTWPTALEQALDTAFDNTTFYDASIPTGKAALLHYAAQGAQG